MKAAPWIEVTAPLEARARYLAAAYEDILSDGARLKDRLRPLRFHRGHALLDSWGRMIDEGERIALCRSLAQDHYDPAYEKSMRAITPTVLQRFETPDLDSAALDVLASRIARALQQTSI